MTSHTYLDQGLSVLHARLRSPLALQNASATTDVRPFLTLSRETGAGATTLGHRLVPLLDREFHRDDSPWVLLDRDLLAHALRQNRLPAGLAEFLPEDRVSEIRATIGELVGLHPSLWQLEQKVAETVLQLAHVGHVILAGRAAHLVTRSLPGGLHVRLVASRETRIARVAATLHRSHEDAAHHIDEQDEARRRFVRANFAADLDDPHLYDLVINTDHFDADTVATLVLRALHLRLRAPRALSVQPTRAP